MYIYILVYLPNFIYNISCLEENSLKTPDLLPSKTAPESILQNVRPREPPPIHDRWFRWVDRSASQNLAVSARSIFPRVGRAKWPIHGVNSAICN